MFPSVRISGTTTLFVASIDVRATPARGRRFPLSPEPPTDPATTSPEAPTLERRAPKMPDLSLPFALVGAAAGWLCCGVLANPLVNLSRNEQRFAVPCATVVAAGVGAWLTRRCGPSHLFADRAATRVRVVFAVLAGGIVAGAGVAGLSWRNAAGTAAGALSGIPCALAFLPVCMLVVAAAHRAARARLGTVVAASDRRAMWGILAAALGVTTLAALPDWPASVEGFVDRPMVALAMALSAGAFLLAMIAADARALVGIARVARAHGGMEPRTAAEAQADAGRVPELDLGLGEEVVAKIARTGSAYRATERAVARIVGSPARARDALRDAVGRKALGVALIAGVLGAHFMASRSLATLFYHERRCDDGSARSCTAAGAMLERGESVASDAATAASYYDRGCNARWPEGKSCAALAALLEGGRLGARDSSRAAPLRDRACEAGDGESCKVLAHLLLRGERPGRDLPRATALVSRACGRGDATSCREIQLFEAIQAADELARPHAIACLEGDAIECDVAAMSWRPAIFVGRLAQLYEHACELGRPYSCHEAAWLVVRDPLLDSARAAALYEKACDGGAGFSCCESAYLHAHARDLPRDLERAARLAHRGAELGFATAGSCGALAREHAFDLPSRP